MHGASVALLWLLVDDLERSVIVQRKPSRCLGLSKDARGNTNTVKQTASAKCQRRLDDLNQSPCCVRGNLSANGEVSAMAKYILLGPGLPLLSRNSSHNNSRDPGT